MDNYNLELSKAVNQIKIQKAKLVLIQLPDGLKPKAKEIKEEIENKTGAEVLIWMGSCYGSCDIPQNLENIDLLIQWGHSEFVRNF